MHNYANTLNLMTTAFYIPASFLYIVPLGVLTTTTAQLVAADGIPMRLKRQGCVHHVPAAREEHVTFYVTKYLREAHADVYDALKHIARVPESKIKLNRSQSSASGDIVLNSLGDVVAWACSARRVQNVRGPKAFAHDGVAMPT